MLQQGGLVGRVVASGSDAVSAAAEGADLVFLEVNTPTIMPCSIVRDWPGITNASFAHAKHHMLHVLHILLSLRNLAYELQSLQVMLLLPPGCAVKHPSLHCLAMPRTGSFLVTTANSYIPLKFLTSSRMLFHFLTQLCHPLIIAVFNPGH